MRVRYPTRRLPPAVPLARKGAQCALIALAVATQQYAKHFTGERGIEAVAAKAGGGSGVLGQIGF